MLYPIYHVLIGVAAVYSALYYTRIEHHPCKGKRIIIFFSKKDKEEKKRM